jgi:hypothetical protein
MLEACVHLALCGPVGPNEFRGYSPSTGDDAPPHKLTVATHARFLFVDNLRLYALRHMTPAIKAYSSASTNHFPAKQKEGINETSEPAPTSLSIEELESRLEEVILKLKQCDLGNIPYESTLERSCSEAECEASIDDRIHSVLIAVGVHQLIGKTSDRVMELIQGLCDEPWPELAQTARWARSIMASGRK